MRLENALKVKTVLIRIKEQENTYVKEAVAIVEQEIAMREQQRRAGLDNKDGDLNFPW